LPQDAAFHDEMPPFIHKVRADDGAKASKKVRKASKDENKALNDGSRGIWRDSKGIFSSTTRHLTME